jgi:hypothetical protein
MTAHAAREEGAECGLVGHPQDAGDHRSRALEEVTLTALRAGLGLLSEHRDTPERTVVRTSRPPDGDRSVSTVVVHLEEGSHRVVRGVNERRPAAI